MSWGTGTGSTFQISSAYLGGEEGQLIRNGWTSQQGPDSLLNGPVRVELAHAGNGGDRLASPTFLVLERLVDGSLRLNVRRKVVGDDVMVAVVGD